MKVIGVTGGIGSGKSTVCKIFETLGVPIFYSDNVSKSILFSKPVQEEVIQLFGNDIMDDGTLSRQKLAELVFSNEDSLSQLTQLLHPKVNDSFEFWKTKQNFPYILKEAAILFESGGYKSCDEIINVCCPESIRIERVVKRDNRKIEEINSIIAKQWSEDKRKKYSNYNIDNENKKLIPQVTRLHNTFIERV